MYVLYVRGTEYACTNGSPYMYDWGVGLNGRAIGMEGRRMCKASMAPFSSSGYRTRNQPIDRMWIFSLNTLVNIIPNMFSQSSYSSLHIASNMIPLRLQNLPLLSLLAQITTGTYKVESVTQTPSMPNSPPTIANQHTNNNFPALQALCPPSPILSIPSLPPIARIVSHGTHIFALQATTAMGSAYPKGLCPTFQTHSSKFNQSGFFVDEMDAVLCQGVCSSGNVVKEVGRFRGLVFGEQIGGIIAPSQRGKLCEAWDRKVGVELFGSWDALDAICKGFGGGKSAIGGGSSKALLGELARLNAELFEAEMHGFFATSADVAATYSGLEGKWPAVAQSLTRLTIDPSVFKRAMCSGGGVKSAEQIHEAIHHLFAVGYTEMLWILGGGNMRYQNWLCAERENILMTPFGNVGFERDEVLAILEKKCT